MSSVKLRAALIILAIVMIVSPAAATPDSSTEYTAPGSYTFTVPPAVTSVDLIIIGGGGGGNSGWASPNPQAGGGAGEIKTVQGVAVTPGSSIHIEVGAGGSSDGPGGSSSFGSISASGGTNGMSGSYDGATGYGNDTYAKQGAPFTDCSNEETPGGLPGVGYGAGGGGGSRGGCPEGGNPKGGAGAQGYVQITFTELIPPVAAFTASPTSGLAPLTVQFTDTSTGDPTSWLWDFGDGSTSTEQHPTHTYTDPGTWTATLTVSNPSGSSTAQTTVAARSADPVSSFGVPIRLLLFEATARFPNAPTPDCDPVYEYTEDERMQPGEMLFYGCYWETYAVIQANDAYNPYTGVLADGTYSCEYIYHGDDGRYHSIPFTLVVSSLPPLVDFPVAPQWDPETGFYTGYWFSRDNDFIDIHGLFHSLLLPLTMIFGSWTFLIIWGTFCMGLYLYTQDTTLPFVVGVLTGSMMAFLMGEDAIVVMLLTMAFCGGGILAKVLLGRI